MNKLEFRSVNLFDKVGLTLFQILFVYSSKKETSSPSFLNLGVL